MKNIPLVTLLLILTLPFVAGAHPPTNQNETAEQAITRLEKEFNDAQLRDDVDALDKILADDLVFSNINDTTNTKKEYLDALRAEGFGWVSIKDEDVKIRVFGDAAIVTLRSIRKHEVSEGDLVIRYTKVYARRQGRWQIVSVHSQVFQPQQAQPKPATPQ
jgi:ketosteroid isomerase-like protein